MNLLVGDEVYLNGVKGIISARSGLEWFYVDFENQEWSGWYQWWEFCGEK